MSPQTARAVEAPSQPVCACACQAARVCARARTDDRCCLEVSTWPASLRYAQLCIDCGVRVRRRVRMCSYGNTTCAATKRLTRPRRRCFFSRRARAPARDMRATARALGALAPTLAPAAARLARRLALPCLAPERAPRSRRARHLRGRGSPPAWLIAKWGARACAGCVRGGLAHAEAWRAAAHARSRALEP